MQIIVFLGQEVAQNAKIRRVQDKGSIPLDALLIIALYKIFDHLKKVRVAIGFARYFIPKIG